MRFLLGVACAAAILTAVLSWQANDGRITTETVHRVVRVIHTGKDQPAHRISLHKTIEDPSSSLRSQALTIALATMALALLGAVAFWDRLSEFRVGSMWFKLLDSRRVRRIRESTGDPDKALDVVELVLDKLGEAAEGGRRVSEKLADDATEAAVAEVQSPLGEHVHILDPDLPRIEIKGAPSEEQVLWATSEDQYLPSGQFPAELVELIERRDEGLHRIYVLESLDLLAAASYEARPGSPLLLHAMATRNDRNELLVRALTAALLATRYLHEVATKLDRAPGLAIAVDAERVQPVTLQELGFRKAGEEETPGLPSGDYWIQYAAE